ncbi:MAG: zinc ribbon domain-containing protein [Bryobacteraceae bacterium]
MPDRCTCGAVLPPDALFCHKCGKPQREDLLPVVEPEPAAPPPLPTIAAPPPIGFHNGPAVRVALMAGILSIVVTFVTGQLALLRPLALVWPVATGVLAVFLYRRATGQRLTPLNGAHLGWICGIFGFVIVVIMLTMIAVALSEPSAVSAMHDQLKDQGISEADVTQLLNVLHSPAGIAGGLLMFFLLFTILPVFGGMIGAKLLDRD